MGQLTNQYVSQSYQGLLNLANPFTGVTNTLQYVTDGLGNNLPLQVSSTEVQVFGLQDTSITGSLKNNGLTYPTVDNGIGSFIQTDGAGNLSLQYVKTMYEEVKNRENVTIPKGTPLFVSGNTGNRADVYIADAYRADRRPATLIASDNILANQNGLGIIIGLIQGVDVGSLPAGQEIFLGASGSWIPTRPTGSAMVQVLGVVSRTGNNGAGYVINQLQSELPNLASGYTWVGNASGTPTPTLFTAGSSGTSGTSGVAGSSGTSGTSGQSGTSGTSGSNGVSGSSGTSGTSGSSGTSGQNGSSGTSGTSGTSGVDGSSGTSGTSGSSGTSGTSGTSGDSIFALTGSVWETSVQTKFNADSTFGTDLTVLQDINLPTGSAIKLTPDSGGNSAAIRFLSGSNPASNRWVNIQGVPGSPAGDVAISDFPTNNHFMFFDVSGHTLQFEAPIRSTGSAAIQILNGVINNTNYTPVIPGVGFINSGSFVNRGDVDVISNNTTLNIDNYITSSLLGQANIFKGWGDNQAAGGAGSNQANYTGSIRITGSNNVVSLPQLRPTAAGGGVDLVGYISGSDNTINTNQGGIFLNTGSLLFPKTTGNFVGPTSNIFMNFTTSSLAGGHPTLINNTLYGGQITLNSNSGSVQSAAVNLINGGALTSTQNFVTNTRPSIATNIVGGTVTLNHISSSINYQSNVNNSPVTVNNHVSSSAIANNNVSISNNTFLGGQGNTGPSFYISGSQSSNLTRNFLSNLIGGASPVVSSSFVSSSNANLLSTIMYGNNLAVSASHTAGTLGGSAFFGRFNMTGSNLEDTQTTVFAVGTGTAANARRTGFRIDNNSNTSISGSLAVNGNSSITGSVNITRVMNLTPIDPLPAGVIGDLAVSSSNQLYFYNGTWTLVV